MFGRKRVKHPTTDLYQYHHGRSPSNGAMEFVFEPTFSLPIYSFRGNARVAGELMGNPKPVYLAHNRVPVAGLGGLQAGQYILQPLTDNPFGE